MRWLPLALLGCGDGLAPMAIPGQAAFAPDGRVLWTESHYATPDPSAPWFADGEARDPELVLVLGDAELAGTEVARLPAGRVGGGADTPVFLLEDQALLALHGVLLAVDTTTGRAQELRPDAASIDAAFGGRETSVDGLLMGYAPSPLGDVAAVYTLALEEGGLGSLEFRHLLAIYAADGALRSTVTLDAPPWTSSDLRLDAPAPELDLDEPAPPQISPYQRLGAPARFLWAEDGQSLFLLATESEPPAGAQVALDGTLTPLADSDAVPALAIPSPSGPVRDDGLALLLHAPIGAENQATLITATAANWLGFEARGSTALADFTAR